MPCNASEQGGKRFNVLIANVLIATCVNVSVILFFSFISSLLCQSGACRAGVHSCLVLAQQRAAPTLVCASKSQVRKHAQMCALSMATPLVGVRHWSVTVFTKVHSRTTRGRTWSMGRSRVVRWCGPPAVHNGPAFPVTTTPDPVSDPEGIFKNLPFFFMSPHHLKLSSFNSICSAPRSFILHHVSAFVRANFSFQLMLDGRMFNFFFFVSVANSATLYLS